MNGTALVLSAMRRNISRLCCSASVRSETSFSRRSSSVPAMRSRSACSRCSSDTITLKDWDSAPISSCPASSICTWERSPLAMRFAASAMHTRRAAIRRDICMARMSAQSTMMAPNPVAIRMSRRCVASRIPVVDLR